MQVTQLSNSDVQQEMQKIIARCWADPEFKASLLSKPKDTLKSMGYQLTDGVEIRVFENTPSIVNFVLPQLPKGEISDEALDAVNGGLNCIATRCYNPGCGASV